jgi:hypothetical protein
MVFFIVLLYIFATICVATNWAYTIYHFIGKGSSSFVQKLHRWPGVAMGINAGIADCITVCYNVQYFSFLTCTLTFYALYRFGAVGLSGAVVGQSLFYQYYFLWLRQVRC